MRSKILIALIILLAAGDAFLLHGRYRSRLFQKAEATEQKVVEQNWSSPMLD